MNFDEYDRMREAEDTYWWFVARRNLALDLLRTHAPQAHRILDLGCGTGALLGALPPDSWAVGVDFSARALEHSHARGLPRLVHGDGRRLPFCDAAFDAVISLDTIEHIDDHEAAAAEIARVLKPGGTAVINVPAFPWLWGPHDVALMHCRRYTRPQVRQLLTGAGLHVQRLTYSVFLLFPVVVARRVWEKTRPGPAEVRLPAVSSGQNERLMRLMDLEARMIHRLNLPWGSSVVAVVQKPGPAASGLPPLS